MLQKTVYFRTKADLDKFNALPNKAQWFHDCLSMAEKDRLVTEPPIIKKVEQPKVALTSIPGVTTVDKIQAPERCPGEHRVRMNCGRVGCPY